MSKVVKDLQVNSSLGATNYYQLLSLHFHTGSGNYKTDSFKNTGFKTAKSLNTATKIGGNERTLGPLSPRGPDGPGGPMSPSLPGLPGDPLNPGKPGNPVAP